MDDRSYLDARFLHLREVIETRLTASDRALDLATQELHRRLDALNGEQARLAADRERFLPREVFDRTMLEQEKWRKEVASSLATRAGQAQGVSFVWAVALGVLPTVLALLALFLR